MARRKRRSKRRRKLTGKAKRSFNRKHPRRKDGRFKRK